MNETHWIADLNASKKDRFNQTVPTAKVVGVESLEFRASMHVLYAAIFVMSLVGNSMVMHVSLQSRVFAKSSYMLLIFNLAICDLLTPMISIPFDIAQTENGEQWLFGMFMCKLLWPCQTLFSTSSSLTLGVICYDRYNALTKPFVGPSSFFRVKLWIALIHLTSCFLVMPYFAVLRLKQHSCVEEWPEPAVAYRQAYTMLLFLVQYAIPLMFMIVLYSVALFTLFSSSSQMFALAASTRNDGASQNEHKDRSQSLLVIQRRKQNLRVTKMFIMVVVVFAVSMFPNQVLWLWSDFAYDHVISLKRVAVICRVFTYSNSVLNPVIYCFCSREFRAGFKRIGLRISLRRRRGHRNANSGSTPVRLKLTSRSPFTVGNMSDLSATSAAKTTTQRCFSQSAGKVCKGKVKIKNHDQTLISKPRKSGALIDSTPTYELELMDFGSKFYNTKAFLEHFKSLPESSV